MNLTTISTFALNMFLLFVVKTDDIVWYVLGWEKNFTNGISAATGDIIFPCDQDDVWHLDKIEKISNAFESNNDIFLLYLVYIFLPV